MAQCCYAGTFVNFALLPPHTYTFMHIQKCENNRRLGKRAEMFIPIIVRAHCINRAECHSSWSWCRCWSCWRQALAQKSTQLQAPHIWRACCFCLVVGKMIILMIRRTSGDVVTLRHMIIVALSCCVCFVLCELGALCELPWVVLMMWDCFNTVAMVSVKIIKCHEWCGHICKSDGWVKSSWWS